MCDFLHVLKRIRALGGVGSQCRDYSLLYGIVSEV